MLRIAWSWSRLSFIAREDDMGNAKWYLIRSGNLFKFINLKEGGRYLRHINDGWTHEMAYDFVHYLNERES